MNIWVEKASIALDEITKDKRVATTFTDFDFNEVCITLYNVLEMMEIPIEELTQIGVSRKGPTLEGTTVIDSSVEWSIVRMRTPDFYFYVREIQSRTHKQKLRLSGNRHG
jgi:hypothetical protein